MSEHVIEKWIGEESVLGTDMKSTLSKCCYLCNRNLIT